MGMQMQQPLSALAPGSVHLGSEILWMQEPYFRMNMKGVNGVEEMKKAENLKNEMRNDNALQ